MGYQPASSGAITDPDVAYVRSDGSAGGDGSPSAPFATWQQAVTAGFTKYKFGVGSFGDALCPFAGVELFLMGYGSDVSGQAGDAATRVGALTAPAGQALTVNLSSIFVDSISTQPSPSAVVGDPGGDGSDISIKGDANSIVGVVSANGGTGGPGDDVTPSGDGGNAGDILLIGPFSITSSISCAGGSAGADEGGGSGSQGADGTLTIRRCTDIPTPTPDAATVAGAVINSVFVGNTYP